MDAIHSSIRQWEGGGYTTNEAFANISFQTLLLLPYDSLEDNAFCLFITIFKTGS